MQNKMIIPPNGAGCRKPGHAGIVDKLRKLEIGEKAEFPITAWSTLGSCAHIAGINIVTRSLGSKERVTVYRIA